jgi:hypothetical protein
MWPNKNARRDTGNCAGVQHSYLNIHKKLQTPQKPLYSTLPLQYIVGCKVPAISFIEHDNSAKLASNGRRKQSSTTSLLQRLQRVESAVQPAKAELHEVRAQPN